MKFPPNKSKRRSRSRGHLEAGDDLTDSSFISPEVDNYDTHNHEAEPAAGASPKRIGAGQAALLLSGAYLLARIIGLVQSTIIGAVLPLSESSAYFAAFRLPDFVNYLIAGGAMSVTFIPIFTELKLNGSKNEAWKFLSNISSLMGTVLAVLIALGIVFADPLVRLMNPGFNVPEKAATLQLTIDMTRVLLPAQLFFYLGGMAVGVLNSHKRFGVSGFTSAVYNLVAILVGVAAWSLFGPIGFAYGILIGAFVGNFAMPVLATLSGPRDERLQIWFAIDWHNPAVRRFFINALPIMLGVSFPVVDQLVVGLFASYLRVEDVTFLTYGNRFMVAPLSILAQAASVAAFPYMATDSAAQNWSALAEFLRTGLRRLMFLAIPMSVLLIVIARPFIGLFVGFGNMSTRNAIDTTAVAFAFYCVGLFAWAGQQFVARGLYALQDTKTPTIIGSILTIFFFFPLCAAAARWGGVLGLALATSVGAAAHFVGILIALESKLKRKPYGVALRSEKILGAILRTLAASLVMGICGLISVRLGGRFFSEDKLGDLMNIVFTSFVSIGAFAAACEVFRIPEWHWMRDKALGRFRRRAAL